MCRSEHAQGHGGKRQPYERPNIFFAIQMQVNLCLSLCVMFCLDIIDGEGDGARDGWWRYGRHAWNGGKHFFSCQATYSMS